MEETTTADAPTAHQATIIQSKIGLPRIAEDCVRRERVESLLAELICHRRVVLVTATAGSGKTTAVVAAARGLERPVAWLGVDRTDTAPGRLVTYLEAALARVVPHLEGVGTRALAAGIPHSEAAGLLAEAIGGEPVVLVVDELERLGEDPGAWSVLEALVRYLPRSVTLVMVSRRAIPATLCALPPTGVAEVGEAELAFEADEAREALSLLGKEEIDAARAVEATGGWVTGVLFEAWRSTEHVAGAGGEADPLYGYLSSQILGGLAPEDREFLETTSLLDEVTAARADALGVREAGRRLVSLSAAHLPVTWSPDGRAMRCHSRFREYLSERLERRGEEALRRLREAHARQLAAEGNDEDATEEFLQAGALEEAFSSAERAIMPVIERVDFAVAERWLDAFGAVAPTGASPLTAAELMLALAKDDIRRVVRIADQLEALGERDRLAADFDAAVWVMAWSYMHVIRRKDAEAVLRAANPGPTVAAVRYAMRVMDDPPGEGSPVRPELTGTPVDAFIATADWALGRLAELTETSRTKWEEAVKLPWRISALRALGQTQRALELYESAESASAALAIETFIGPEVLIDAGHADAAHEAIARGRARAQASGTVALEAMNALAEAKLALRLDRDPRAAQVALDRPACRAGADGYRLMNEIRDTWLGLALLLESRDADALDHLRRAVDGMVAGDRLLELPTAAVYRAEAEWRAGDEDAADRAAALALATARRQGSNHVLLQALADFPAVVARQIDAQPAADSPWHDIGRGLIAQGVAFTALVRASVELGEFGRRSLLVNGEPVRPRIAKAYELLSYLATLRPPHAERQELLEVLFDGRADESSRSYLRQSVNALRHVLPDGALAVEDGRVSVSDELVVSAESVRFESELAEAARLQGENRLAATLAALEIYDQGEYLPGVRSRWADERDRHLADLATDARHEAAELALAAGRYEQARALNEEVVRVDPLREAAWRLAMRIADVLGDENGVVRAYQMCEQALAPLGAVPSASTKELLARLRR